MAEGTTLLLGRAHRVPFSFLPFFVWVLLKSHYFLGDSLICLSYSKID